MRMILDKNKKWKNRRTFATLALIEDLFLLKGTYLLAIYF